MIRAAEARNITEADIKKELELIEQEIRKNASLGNWSIDYRLPTMPGTHREKIIATLQSNGYDVIDEDWYDPPSSYGGHDLRIGWEKS